MATGSSSPASVVSRVASASASPRRRLPTLPRVLALAGALALLFAVVAVPLRLVRVAGDPERFLVALGVVIVLATMLATAIGVRTALVLAAAVLAAGLALWLTTLPLIPSPVALVVWNLEMLAGRTVLTIANADAWAIAVTPGPVFAIWFLAVRRRYDAATVVGGLGLGYFAFTGDAGTVTLLVGVVAAGALVGFGDLDRGDGGITAAEYVILTLAALVVAPLVVTVVPGGVAAVALTDGGGSGGGADTVEGNVVSSDERLAVQGSISLSPDVRFIVESDDPAYWQTGTYDRYTGDGWVSTNPQLIAALSDGAPPGSTEEITARITAETPLDAVPAPWRPTDVDGEVEGQVRFRADGSVEPTEPIEPGSEYVVTSESPNASVDRLTDAGTDYPPSIERRYLQLPESTSDRVASLAANVTVDAATPYEKATAVESWLQDTKSYDLDVDRPEGDVAEAFLFEMDAGYCTYFATSMVTMLRTQDVPARLTVGYSPGERVDDDRWKVRGLNAHAWVQVYFPGEGWVDFDPTPSEPWTEARQAQIDEEGADGDDADESTSEGNETASLTQRPDREYREPNLTERALPVEPGRGGLMETTVDVPDPSSVDGGDEGIGIPALPPREHVFLGLVVLAGTLAGARRTDLGGGLRRAVATRWQRRSGDPARDVERAYRRLELVCEHRYRPRRPGETVREYLDAVGAGPEAERVAAIRERSRYGEGVSRDAADRAIELVDRIRDDA